MTSPEAPDDGVAIGRRVVLGLLGLGAAGVAFGSAVSRGVGAVSGALSRHDPTGVSSYLPGAGWRYYTVSDGYPYRPPSSYRLAVGGNVDTELSLSIGDLRARRRTRITADFQCVTGWRVRGVRWEGVRLSDLLDEARVQPGQTAVEFVSYDGVYTESLSLAEARRPDVLVADTLGGDPIGRSHGGPARLLVVPMYGYKSCKWLAEINVRDQLVLGYWERYGYAQHAWVGRSNGRRDNPT